MFVKIACILSIEPTFKKTKKLKIRKLVDPTKTLIILFNLRYIILPSF
jgi:hypothetical protein